MISHYISIDAKLRPRPTGRIQKEKEADFRLQLTLATAHAYISALQIFELISYYTIYIYHIYQALTTTGTR